MNLRSRLADPRGPRSLIIVRLIVGAVFLSESIQKSLFPDALGVGRFTKIGIAAPDVMAPIVGVVEIVCGLLMIGGLLTRLAGYLSSSTCSSPSRPRSDRVGRFVARSWRAGVLLYPVTEADFW